jgi:uncharacterized protein
VALKEQINNDLKTALLSGNRLSAEVLRGLKATILNEEVASNKRETGLEDSVIEQLIAREIKKRNETAEIYINAGRSELADKEKQEAGIMSNYLPKQLTEEEIETVVKRLMLELGINSSAAFGQLIGATKKELGSSADGALIAKVVKNILS